ncbi:MAG: hypothetical protein RMJ37_06340 [Spirochaetia bacterium]|nr:hypothetical protein [Spirochaetota bacterium]MDW8112932.1 hypothetical protein [Spirochaetia bacterium]
MNRTLTTLLVVSAVVLLILALLLGVINEENRLHTDFVNALKDYDYEKANLILDKMSNVNISRYYLLKGVKDLLDGNEKSGLSNLFLSLSNTKLGEKEIALSKLLIGQYLLLEVGDIKGIQFLTDEGCQRYYKEYADYTLGVYNFNKESYDEALDFLIGVTNARDEKMKKDTLLRLYFINMLKSNYVDESLKKQLSDFEISPKELLGN